MVELAQNMLQLFETPWFVYFVALCVLIVILPFVHTMMNDRRRARFYRRHGLSCPRRGTLFWVVWIMFTVGIAVLIFGVTIGFSWVISRVNPKFQNVWEFLNNPATGDLVAAIFFFIVSVLPSLLIIYLFYVVYVRREAGKKEKFFQQLLKEARELVDSKRATWIKNQAWRSATDIRFIERLKEDLVQFENRLDNIPRTADTFLSAVASDSFLVAVAAKLNQEIDLSGKQLIWKEKIRFFFAQIPEHQDLLRDQSIKERADELRTKIDRIWAGDAHQEIEDRKDEIERLQRKREECRTQYTEYVNKSALNEYDEQIAKVDRELRDLVEIVKRARERQKEGEERAKHEKQFAETLKIQELQGLYSGKKKAKRWVFKGARNLIEAARQHQSLLKELEADTSIDEDMKPAIRAAINRNYERLKEKFSPETEPNALLIYEEEDEQEDDD